MKKRTLAALMAVAVLLTGCKNDPGSTSDNSSDVSSVGENSGTENIDPEPADLGGDVPYTSV